MQCERVIRVFGLKGCIVTLVSLSDKKIHLYFILHKLYIIVHDGKLHSLQVPVYLSRAHMVGWMCLCW